MLLLDLTPEFVKVDVDTKLISSVEGIGEADGVMLLCPKCFDKNGGEVGTHRVICWKPSVPQSVYPVPGRWNLVGTSLEDLTLKAGSSSVALTGGCKAHFFITDGKIKQC